MFTRIWNLPDTDSEEILDEVDMEAWTERYQKHRREVLDTIYPALRDVRADTRKKNAKAHDASKRIVPPLQVGDRVMVEDPNPASKHAPKYLGPFTVKAVNPTGSYLVANSQGHTFQRTRSALKLIPAVPNPESEAPLFDIERLLDRRVQNGRTEYLVKWRGYGPAHNSWEPAEHLEMETMIRDFEESLKKKRPGRATAPKQSKRQRRT
jgi:hypothetical protein